MPARKTKRGGDYRIRDEKSTPVSYMDDVPYGYAVKNQNFYMRQNSAQPYQQPYEYKEREVPAHYRSDYKEPSLFQRLKSYFKGSGGDAQNAPKGRKKKTTTAKPTKAKRKTNNA
jgi:hypothetical protein